MINQAPTKELKKHRGTMYCAHSLINVAICHGISISPSSQPPPIPFYFPLPWWERIKVRGVLGYYLHAFILKHQT